MNWDTLFYCSSDLSMTLSSEWWRHKMTKLPRLVFMFVCNHSPISLSTLTANVGSVVQSLYCPLHMIPVHYYTSLGTKMCIFRYSSASLYSWNFNFLSHFAHCRCLNLESIIEYHKTKTCTSSPLSWNL